MSKRPYYYTKTATVKKEIIKKPWKLPMAAQHLAAILIQKIIRGVLARKRLTHPEVTTQKVNRLKEYQTGAQALRSKYLASQYHASSSTDEFAFKEFCAILIQATYRMSMIRRIYKLHRFAMYHVAAIQIQWAWRNYQTIAARRVPLAERKAVEMIQRTWRSYTNQKIYRFYKEMLYFHQKGNPKDILRAINPSEAFLIDGASNIHIRFRLGGEKFPPLIYYKIYTHGGICDINSYAPRDYTMVRKVTMKETVDMEFESEEAKNVTDGWYERYDNNGWRPITDNILAPFDAVELRTASKPVVYHYSKLKRREMVAMEKRKRKINWLKKLYSDAKKTEEAELMEKLNEGQAGEDITIENIGSIDNYEGEDDLSDRMGNTARTLEKLLAADDNPFNDEKLLEMDPNQFEEHVNDLIEWSETLDYDKYVLEWNLIGTTAGHLQTVPDYEY